MKLITTPIPLLKTFLTLLTAFIFGYVPLVAQNQYWQIELENDFAFGANATGLIQVDDLSLDVYNGSLSRKFSHFGKSLIPIPGGGILHQTFFIDKERSDIVVNATLNAFNGKLTLEAASLETPELKYPVDLSAEFGDDLPAIYKPICLKVDGNSYLLVDQENVFHVSIFDVDDYQIDYTLAHNSEQITSGVVKDGVAYLADVNGNILRYDNQGFLDQSNLQNISPFSIAALDDGFVLTGENNGQMALAKINDQGISAWQKTFDQERGMTVIAAANGDLVVTGSTTTGTGFVLRTDANGNEIWQKEISTVPGITVTENKFGALYTICRTLAMPVESFLIKLGPNGETGPMVDTDNSFPLEVNNIEANVSPLGQLFFDGNESNYFFPAGSDIATIFAADLWISATDNQGELHLAARQYTGNQDYQMGPFASEPEFFQRVWSVSQAEIDMINEDLSDGMQNLDWPLDILQWPAKGNTLTNSNGDSYLIEEALAPFVDKNNDGLYDPSDGDFPLIKGEQMLWWVFNDGNPNSITDAENVDVEIRASLYANGCNPDHIGNNTTFLDYEIINHAEETYPTLSLGFWSDPDLGCYTDDFIGSMPDYNAAYVYNEDALDGSVGTSCPGGVNSYGEEVPIQAMVFLNQPLNSFTYAMNPSVGNPPPGTGDPSIAQGYHNLMNGLWIDGTPLTFGDFGYDPASTDYTSYAFSGEPSNIDEWSLCSVGPLQSDRRMIMGTNFENYNSGDVIELKMAFITSEGANLPCPSLDILKTDIEAIQAIHDNGGATYVLDLDQYSVIGENSATLDAGAGAASYLWSTGETTQSIEVTMMQDYSVTITDFFGCEQVDQITVDFTSNVTDGPLAAANVSLHPNPANDFIYVQSLNGQPITDLTIYSMEGKLIKSIRTQTENNQFSVGDLHSGMYLINIKIPDGVVTKKFIKL